MIKATLEDLEKELWLRNRNAGSIVWVTKEGKEVPIKDMTDEHLENTIKMIHRVRDSRNCYERMVGNNRGLRITPITPEEVTPRDIEYDDWFWKN